ncbi:MAG: Z1 domain-containing protein [Bacteroidales bacterium]|nr:Z1 domain-containing protein [Bacteroidales bacterium]
MATMLVNNKPSSGPKKKVKPLQTVIAGERFDEFVNSQTIGYHLPNGDIRKNGLNGASVGTFKRETIDIMSHCNPHNAVDKNETTHLAVGYVQSGKTMSFTALTALAWDNHYRIVVYLAGTKKNLQHQTAERLELDLIKNIKGNKDYFRVIDEMKESNINELMGFMRLSTRPVVLLPILKHHTHIDELTKVFKRNDFKTVMSGETVLIIDDEADQASLNSFGRKNSKHPDRDEDEVSSTYESIIKMRAELPGNTYIQYTATPQANILISMQDLLSPKTHTLLTPGTGYTGGLVFFGLNDIKPRFGGQLVKDIPQDDVLDKKLKPWTKIPKSLRQALLLHVLSTAIVVKWRKENRLDYLSMMVHIDTRKEWNKKFKLWIDKAFSDWQIAFAAPDGQDDKTYLIDELRSIFPEAVSLYAKSKRPTFEEILPLLNDVLNDKKVYLVNTDKQAETDIKWDKHCMHILVGAEMLNRGFTINNLATTYMPRYAIGATNADTIQQRCRFYGYKESYLESCRVFLPADSVQHYKDYIEHEEELRSVLSSTNTLEGVEQQILLSPTLRPTRVNILPVSVVNTKLTDIRSLNGFSKENLIRNNAVFVEGFIKENESEMKLVWDYGAASNTHRGKKISVDEAILFLSQFHFGEPKDIMYKAATIRYLRFLSSLEGGNKLNDVMFIQMAYTMEGKKLRERDLIDVDGTFKLGSTLLQGAGGAYKGDSSIVAPDTVTIQLHHIGFKNKVRAGFPLSGYTLAINYPEELATRYAQNCDYTDTIDSDNY